MKKCTQCGATEFVSDVIDDTIHVGSTTFVVSGVPCERCVACREYRVSLNDMGRAELTVAASLAQMGVRTGSAFKFMRKALGLKAVQLSELLGVQPETMSRWERETQPVESRSLALLGALVADRVAGRDESTMERLKAIQEPRVPADPVHLRVA